MARTVPKAAYSDRKGLLPPASQVNLRPQLSHLCFHSCCGGWLRQLLVGRRASANEQIDCPSSPTTQTAACTTLAPAPRTVNQPAAARRPLTQLHLDLGQVRLCGLVLSFCLPWQSTKLISAPHLSAEQLHLQKLPCLRNDICAWSRGGREAAQDLSQQRSTGSKVPGKCSPLQLCCGLSGYIPSGQLFCLLTNIDSSRAGQMNGISGGIAEMGELF